MASKLVVVVCAVLIGLVALGWSTTAQAFSGVTIAPAALRLELSKGHSQTTTSFAVTNNYRTAVTLNFAFEPAAGNTALTTDELKTFLSISDPLLVVAAGDTVTQTITLVAAKQLAPGSQAVVLSVGQQATGATTGVSIAPRIELPLTLVQQDGALSAFSATHLNGGGFGFSLPSKPTVQLTNTGNMIVIPRGVVTVTGPRGKIVSQGALNTASLALSPGGTLALQTALTPLAASVWPGPYTVTMQYGLGGGAATKSFAVTRWYLAWWHILAALLLAASFYFGIPYGKKQWRTLKAKRHKLGAKPPVLIGRDSS